MADNDKDRCNIRLMTNVQLVALLNGFTQQLHFQYEGTPSEYLRHRSVSKSSVQGEGHGSEKAVTCNSNTTGRQSLAFDGNICYDVIQNLTVRQLPFQCEGISLEYQRHLEFQGHMVTLKVMARE